MELARNYGSFSVLKRLRIREKTVRFTCVTVAVVVIITNFFFSVVKFQEKIPVTFAQLQIDILQKKCFKIVIELFVFFSRETKVRRL